MDLSRTVVASSGHTSLSVKERRKHLKSILRSIRKIAANRLRDVRLSKPRKPLRRPTQDLEPLRLGQRIVFRSQGQVPVKQLVAFHRLIKNDQVRASKLVSLNLKGEPTRPHNSAILCALRTSFEEQLKITAQLTGLFPPDPDLTRPTQQLFEQFYLAHGIPNDAESELLQAVGYVDAEIVDAWFTLKTFRLRAYLKFRQMFKKAILKARLAEKFSRGLKAATPPIAKPYSRH